MKLNPYIPNVKILGFDHVEYLLEIKANVSRMDTFDCIFYMHQVNDLRHTYKDDLNIKMLCDRIISALRWQMG